MSDAELRPGPVPGPADPSTYGPSALATPANAVTIVRLLASPVLFAIIVRDGATWITFVLWTVLASTDGIDGWMARRMGTTRSGAFLDPLADKVLVLGAMFALVSIDRWPVLPVAVILARELFISLYRVHLGRQGVAMPARASAKAKTFLQSIAIGCALAPPLDELTWIADAVLWASVVVAVVSAAQYVLDGSRAHTTMERSHPTGD